MTPRRKQTMDLSGQPVRFYKIVALSFLLLTIILLGVIVFMSSKRAVITIVTNPSPVNVNSTVQIDNNDPDGGLVTSTIVELKKTFKPKSTKEEVSVATGKVILHNELDYDQPLVATTRLLSPNDVLFRLKDRVTVPANGTIEAEVYADEEGKESEIGPTKFTIPGLREETQQYIYAVSDEQMKGGVRTYGVLTEYDLEKAQKEMLVELKEAGKQDLSETNLSMEGVFEVVNSLFETDVELNEEIEEFELEGSAVVAGFFYNKDKVVELARSELEKRVVTDAEFVSSGDVEPTITLGDYDLEEGMAVLNVFCNGLVEIDPNSQQLSKVMFFGKSKDEIRRYLLSLDHVQNVEIKFSPAWMRSVPHVAEHVNVVVKKVE